MLPDRIDAAAGYLADARHARKPGPRLPEECRPQDIESALAIQQRVTELLGYAVGAWKCGSPPPGKVFAAPIYAPDIFTASPCSILPSAGVALVEPEIAFRLGRDLPPRGRPYEEAEVRDAIAETLLVLEVMGCRYAQPETAEFPEMLADCLSNQGLYLGPQARPLPAFRITTGGHETAVQNLDGRHPVGDPHIPLYWLANFLAAQGQGLTAGQLVTTGSYAGVLEVPLDCPFRIRFGELGTIKVEFTSLFTVPATGSAT